MDDYAAMNAAYGSYFTDRVPARTTVQAAALPRRAPAWRSHASATRTSRGISVVRPPRAPCRRRSGRIHRRSGPATRSTCPAWAGRIRRPRPLGKPVEAQVTQTVANITTTLKAAGLDVSDVAWAQGYATRLDEAAALQATLAKAIDSPRGLVVVPRLPGPIRAELTFIATRASESPARASASGTLRASPHPRRRRGSTFYVDASSAPGDSIEAAARQVFSRLGDVLKAGGAGSRDVALVTVYLTDIADLPRMNAVFKETFPTDPPARVTIQVQPQAKERIRVSLIAAPR